METSISPVRITGFERFAIWTTAGAFQIGSSGRPLFYPHRSARAFVFQTRREWRRSRIEITVALSLVALATITSTAGRSFLSIAKITAILIALLMPWYRLRGLQRAGDQFREEEVDRARHAVMDRSLALGLVEVGAGWGALSTFLVRLELGAPMTVLFLVGAGLVADGLRRLSERRAVAPEVALTWSASADEGGQAASEGASVRDD